VRFVSKSRLAPASVSFVGGSGNGSREGGIVSEARQRRAGEKGAARMGVGRKIWVLQGTLLIRRGPSFETPLSPVPFQEEVTESMPGQGVPTGWTESGWMMTA
jgi:hypothetical protein